MTHAMAQMWLTHDVRRVHVSHNPNGTLDVFLKTLRGKVVCSAFIKTPRRTS